ncbi:hypothetical protein E2320_006773 [Naja naja]|nr:hypothetical protein E2320_006773 [Naja naja]
MPFKGLNDCGTNMKKSGQNSKSQSKHGQYKIQIKNTENRVTMDFMNLLKVYRIRIFSYKLAVTTIHSKYLRKQSIVATCDSVINNGMAANIRNKVMFNRILVLLLCINKKDRTFQSYHPVIFVWLISKMKARSVLDDDDKI